MKKSGSQKILKLILVLLIIIYPFMPLSNSLNPVSAENAHDLILAVDPTGSGTISGYKNYNQFQTITSGEKVPVYTPITIKAAPTTSSHEFDHWEFPAGFAYDEDGKQAIFTMPDYPLTVKAHFVEADVANTLNLAESLPGSGTLSGYKNNDPSQIVTSGEKISLYAPVNIIATPAKGYAFDHWRFSAGAESPDYVTGGLTTNNLSLNMPDYPVTVTAHFVETEFVEAEVINTLNVVTDPSGSGTISGYKNNDLLQPITSGEEIPGGTPIKLDATRASGYVLDHWEFPEGFKYEQNGEHVAFTMPAMPLTVTAHFRKAVKANALTLIADPSGSGTISGYKNNDPSQIITSGEEILEGTPINLIATPTSNYTFHEWRFIYEGGSSNYATPQPASGDLAIRMYDVPLTIIANFNSTTDNTLTFAVDPLGSGTISGYKNYDPSQIVTSGEKISWNTPVKLTATPASGYMFDGWQMNVDDNLPKRVEKHPANMMEILMPSQSVTVTAIFVEKGATNALTLAVDPAGSGTISGYKNNDMSQTITSGEEIEYGAPINLRATPISGYVFDHWEFPEGFEYDNSGNQVIFPMPEVPLTVIAHFKESPVIPTSYSLTLETYPIEGGIIKDASDNVVTPGVINYNVGSQISFTAEPKPGYKFKKWIGNYINDQNTQNIHFAMPNHNVKLDAIFEKENAEPIVPKTSDNFNIHPYTTVMLLSAGLYFLLKISGKKDTKRYEA